MEFLNPACSNCCRKKRHVEGIKTACWKMVLLNPACWKKIQHVETATDKKRHVEVKSSMLKINKACWQKRHVPAQKFLLMIVYPLFFIKTLCPMLRRVTGTDVCWRILLWTNLVWNPLYGSQKINYFTSILIIIFCGLVTKTKPFTQDY